MPDGQATLSPSIFSAIDFLTRFALSLLPEPLVSICVQSILLAIAQPVSLLLPVKRTLKLDSLPSDGAIRRNHFWLALLPLPGISTLPPVECHSILRPLAVSDSLTKSPSRQSSYSASL